MDSGNPVMAVESFRALFVFRARPGFEAALESSLVAASHIVRNDAGLVGLTLARSVEYPGAYMVLSRWEDRITLTECLRNRQDEGLTDPPTLYCDSIAFDVLTPCDQPGAVGPVPGRVGKLMVARIAIPLTPHIAAAREVMDARTRLLQAYPGCLWVMGNTHSDRGDFLFSCSGWESRLAWETANQDLDLPNLWTDLTGMFNAVSLDLLEPILELVPDTAVLGGSGRHHGVTDRS